MLVVMPSKYSNGRDLGILNLIIPIPWAEQFGRVIVEAYSNRSQWLVDSGAIAEFIYSNEYLAKENDKNDLED